MLSRVCRLGELGSGLGCRGWNRGARSERGWHLPRGQLQHFHACPESPPMRRPGQEWKAGTETPKLDRNSTENARWQNLDPLHAASSVPIPPGTGQDIALMQPLGASTALGPCHPGLAGREPLGSRWARLQT